MGKRYRRPKVKDGEIKVQWGKTPHDSPDIVYYYEKIFKANIYYINGALSPMLEELEKRGFDLKTFKMSISKKSEASHDRLEI